MSHVIKAETSWTCTACRKPGRKGARVISVGGFYRHPKCEYTPGPGYAEDPLPVTGLAEDPSQQVSETVDWQAQASAAAKRHAEQNAGVLAALEDRVRAVAPTLFEDPTPASETDELNVSGQPKARYQWRGSQNLGYLVKDPATGDFRRYKNGSAMGWTRATTFNKAASSTTALTAWAKRNVVIGATRRPDALLKAHGLTHETGRRELDAVVADLEEAAGAKVGADIGTLLHAFTEQMDAGLKTWRDAPPQYQRQLALYSQALADAGFEPVPGLIERTTGITEFGGVVGTFDRIFYHRPSGRYVIGDLKTGKTMDYAMDETQCQEWIYAHGINQNGLYDWNTDTWERAWPEMTDRDPDEYSPIKVSETVGLIIHMPVQGDQAGTVNLIAADLVKGARYARLCDDVRSWTKSKPGAYSWQPEPEAVPEGPQNPTDPVVWEHLFAAVQDGSEAGMLWERAREAGVDPMELNRLVQIAQRALAVRG